MQTEHLPNLITFHAVLWWKADLLYIFSQRNEEQILAATVKWHKEHPTLEPMVLGHIEQHMTMQPAEKVYKV